MALDTTPILGRWAVNEAYNLLDDGIRQLIRTLARVQNRELAPAVLATVPVHVLCDQGLCSRDLWAQIVALGWHPCLRYPPPGHLSA